ncbi:MAG: B12-binding domain-containing radical SAM protein [Gammaproteobacteria bacterium]
MSQPAPKQFVLELVKPSHYDDEGYVIQWWRAWIPSNSLSSVYGLALEAKQRGALGAGVELEIDAYDETNCVIPVRRIIRRIRDNGGHGIVCLIGVQTNQFPRAIDLARRFRAAGLQVAIGGFHVSGCLSMLPEMPADLQEAMDLGITLFAGEAEGRFDEFLRAAYERRLAPLYNYMHDLPGLGGQPIPFLPREYVRRYTGHVACFDAGRGCPFTCSFCTIINVQGRKSRYREADDVEQLIRANAAQGIISYFITDDNFARNKNWEPIFDRMIELQEKDGLKTRFVMQVDTLCHKIPNFIEKAARAGCKRVFLGLENINPDSLKAASKGQNRITEYRRMLQAWRKAGVVTYCGYILGFPGDTQESIRRDIGIVQRELPVDMLEFFILTPLPGSQDHMELLLKGQWMDPDMNKYDLEHALTAHPQMSLEELQQAYDRAWHQYYSWSHIETLLKRAIATGIKPSRLSGMIFQFYAGYRYEKVHPLQSGLIRRKVRSQRRSGMPRENPVVFYARRLREVLCTYPPALYFYWRLRALRKRLKADPAVRHYVDAAITPAGDDDNASLELYQGSEAARRAVAKTQARKETIRRARAAVPA